MRSATSVLVVAAAEIMVTAKNAGSGPRSNPESFGALDRTGTLAQDNVRIGRDGLFVADRKVADLSQVVETITPNEVSEIWGPVVARGSVLGTIPLVQS
jgi:hypothetical protein